VKPGAAAAEPPKPLPKVGDVLRAKQDADGFTKADHLEKAAEFLKIGGAPKVKQAVANAKAWLQKKWEGATAAVAAKMDSMSTLVAAHTSKRNEGEKKAAAQLEKSPEEYAKKLAASVPPEMVKDTEEAINTFAGEKDEKKKEKKKKKVQEYAEESSKSLIFDLLKAVFAPVAASLMLTNWMAKKVGINIFGKKGEAAGDVVKSREELDSMIVQETLALLKEGTTAADMQEAVKLHLEQEGEAADQGESRRMRLSDQIAKLRAFTEKDNENPDQYRTRVGKCPPGFYWDGTSCSKGKAPAKTPSSSEPAAAPGAEPPQPAPAGSAPKGLFAKAKAFASKKLQQAKTDAQTIAQATKDWGNKAKDFVTNAPTATKAFFTDPPYRRAALLAGHAALTQAPGKFAKKAVETVKHEAEEFKMAGSALKTLAQKKSWKALDKHQKHALKTVTKHLALTIGAAAATATGVGIAAGTAKGLAKHIAAKTAGNVFAKLHTAEELQHLSHLFHDEQGDAEGEAAVNAVAKLVEKEIAAMFKAGVDPKNLEAVAERVADEGTQQESNVMPFNRPLNFGAQLAEWTFDPLPLHEATSIRRWTDVGDGVQSAYNGLALKHGRYLKLDDPQGDITPQGVVDVGFAWEMRPNIARKEIGHRDGKVGGECGFKMQEHGSSVTATAESRAWGSAPWGGADAKPQTKSFRGKTRGDVANLVFAWLAKVMQNQEAEAINGVYDAKQDSPDYYGFSL
jgi:hypothetical protein